MKIAAVTDNGKTISAHFGRARYYVVVTVEDDVIVAQEMRPKAGHHDFAHEQGEGSEHEHGPGREHSRGHGWGVHAQSRHARMFSAITDCQVLLARGMGAGAYYGLQEAGIRPIVTTMADVHEAVSAYVEGHLQDHPEKLH
jgi:predicted Fe-Mo cluster-binding NifX family protein